MKEPNELQKVSKALEILGVVRKELGDLFDKIKEDKLYQTQSGIETWREYILSPEVNISVDEAEKLIKLAKLKINHEYVSYNNQKLLAKVKEDHDGYEELLGAAEVLTSRDLRERIYDFHQGSQDRTYKYVLMKRCNETGSLSKVMDEEMLDAVTSVTKPLLSSKR